jgi:hypothetical protein
MSRVYRRPARCDRGNRPDYPGPGRTRSRRVRLKLRTTPRQSWQRSSRPSGSPPHCPLLGCGEFPKPFCGLPKFPRVLPKLFRVPPEPFRVPPKLFRCFLSSSGSFRRSIIGPVRIVIGPVESSPGPVGSSSRQVKDSSDPHCCCRSSKCHWSGSKHCCPRTRVLKKDPLCPAGLRGRCAVLGG